MKTIVWRWGQNIGLGIQRAHMHIKKGSVIVLSLQGCVLVVSAIMPKRHRLSDLVSHVTPTNRHEMIESGKAIGIEAWN
jgi:antitoxin component of MazEF toxin-antitoxin module